MHSINLHQTSVHAVLIIHLPSIDPVSVSSQILPSHHAAEISFNHTDSDATRLATTVLVQPVLSQEQQPLHTDPIQECSYSVAPENIVIRLKKTNPSYEWQALQLHFKTLPTSANNDQSSLSSSVAATDMGGVFAEQTGGDGERVTSLVIKFVTAANTTSFQEAILSQPLWESQEVGSHVVGNVQAKRVPGMNAIQTTAELVAPSSSS